MAAAKKPKIKVVYKGKHGLPEYQTPGSAAVDLVAEIGKDEMLLNGQSKLIPTGLYVEVPEGYCLKIYARSGIAHKLGLSPSNCVGIIDADYRGQIRVSLANSGTTAQVIKPGDRIAQMILEKVERIEWQEVKEITDTERGRGGFGSTGVKADATGKQAGSKSAA
jgi:dUTP pyrophosphatase